MNAVNNDIALAVRLCSLSGLNLLLTFHISAHNNDILPSLTSLQHSATLTSSDNKFVVNSITPPLTSFLTPYSVAPFLVTPESLQVLKSTSLSILSIKKSLPFPSDAIELIHNGKILPENTSLASLLVAPSSSSLCDPLPASIPSLLLSSTKSKLPSLYFVIYFDKRKWKSSHSTSTKESEVQVASEADRAFDLLFTVLHLDGVPDFIQRVALTAISSQNLEVDELAEQSSADEDDEMDRESRVSERHLRLKDAFRDQFIASYTFLQRLETNSSSSSSSLATNSWLLSNAASRLQVPRSLATVVHYFHRCEQERKQMLNEAEEFDEDNDEEMVGENVSRPVSEEGEESLPDNANNLSAACLPLSANANSSFSSVANTNASSLSSSSSAASSDSQSQQAEKILMLTNMGFDAGESRLALVNCNWNVQQAVSLLIV